MFWEWLCKKIWWRHALFCHTFLTSTCLLENIQNWNNFLWFICLIICKLENMFVSLCSVSYFFNAKNVSKSHLNYQISEDYLRNFIAAREKYWINEHLKVQNVCETNERKWNISISFLLKFQSFETSKRWETL